MRRFFFDNKDRHGDTILLSSEESRHIKTVLRLSIGDRLELLDGLGTIHEASITEIGKRLKVDIIATRIAELPSGTKLQVIQAMLKGKKTDFTVQKCTELGVDSFIPFVSSRCQHKMDEKRQYRKHERYLKIVEETCKQCTRPYPMEVENITNFEDILTEESETNAVQKILFWEEEKNIKLAQLPALNDYSEIKIILGPEGGFSKEEVALAKKNGWHIVSLGKRILRAETATITAVSVVQHLLGNI